MLKFVALFAAVTVANACRMTPPPPPVPVQGENAEIAAFSGDWVGRYSSETTRRHGIIRFNLPEQADTGYGEVEITFSPSLHLSREAKAADYPKGDSDELPTEPCTHIGIRIVRIEDDQVRGTMAPYWDPDCECRAFTVFEGKLTGNSITGTFSTRRESSQTPSVTGSWQVERSTR